MKQATIWTQKDCFLCKQVKDLLKNNGYEVEEIPAKEIDLTRDIELKTQLAYQNLELPVIMLEGKLVDINEVQSFLKNEEENK